MSEPTVHITSAGAPNGIGEHFWDNPESVCAVPEDLAHQLLRNVNSGFALAEPYVALPKRVVAAKKEPSLVNAILGESPELVADEGTEEGPLGTALNLVDPKPKGRPRKAS